MKRVRPADMTEIYALRADTIDYFFPEREEEIDFWAELASNYGKDILHLMCGTGEIMLGLAKKGFNVTGLDITDSMIYQCKEKFEEEGIENFYVYVDDARHFNLKKTFDFIFISTGDFHHFIEEKEIRNVLARCYAHLKQGGALALELFPPSDKDFKLPEKRHRPFRDTPKGLRVWKQNASRYHSDKQMLEIMERLHVEEEGVITEGEYEIQLKLHTKEEIEKTLENSGFDDINHHEDFDESSSKDRPDSWVVVAHR